MTRQTKTLALMVTATLTLSPVSAIADVKKAACIEANTKAQDLRREGKLSEARGQLRTCADPSCPELVRDDCTKRLDDLERAQPTIIFGAKDASGRDMGAVAVTVDGRPLAEKLDGTPLRVDPGEHVFTFSAGDQSPVTQTFIIREGERDRRESLVIGPPAPPDQAPAPTPAQNVEGPSGSASTSARLPDSTAQGMGTRR